jgi:threonine/homoserine/homoserine lactone efflux protein
MSQSLLVAFVVFAAVMAFTPGPNNILVLSSGVTHGLRLTVPAIAGIGVGLAFMIAVVGAGLGAIFFSYPTLQVILKYVGAAYLIYLAAMIALSKPAMHDQDNRRAPMTFWGAAIFQWVNIKGWVMVIGANTAYQAIAGFPLNIAVMAGVMLILGMASSLTWTVIGSSLRHLLNSERAVRTFNIVMALLLLSSLLPVFMDA